MLLRDKIEKLYLIRDLDLDLLAFMLGKGGRKVYARFIKNEFSAVELMAIAEMSGTRLAFVDPEERDILFYIGPDSFSTEQQKEIGLGKNPFQVVFKEVKSKLPLS